MADIFSIQGLTAVVTGAAGDIGRCYVQGLSERGCRVLAVDKEADRLEAALVQWNREMVSIAVADIVNESAVERLFADEVSAKLGRLDLLVNNAGVMVRAAPEETKFEDWRFLMGVNLDGAFLCARAAGRIMKVQGSGSIVNISSISSVKALDGRVAYCTSKAAIAHMTRVMALEWGPHGVRVNAIAPGFIRSSMNADLRRDPERFATMSNQVPIKRFAEPEELIGALVFLTSPAASYVNGHVLFVDGGLQVT